MSPQEWAEVEALNRIEPRGWRQLGYMFARVIEAIFVAAGAGADTPRVDDLLEKLGYPPLETAAEPQSAEDEEEDLEAFTRQMVSAYGG